MLVDATTAVEDGSFWDNAGFDTDRHRGRRHRLPARRAARRLDDHPAARPPAAAAREQRRAVTDLSATRKLREIIQSIRVTEAYPGVEGKQRIMAAYLNQNYYGNESYGVAAAAQGYFGVRSSTS